VHIKIWNEHAQLRLCVHAKLDLIYCDNTLSIALSKSHAFHQKNKHLDTRYHFTRKLVNKGDIYLEPCKSQDHLDEIFTNPLAIDVFEFHRKKLGVIDAKAFNGCN